ncbi:rRNA maturation RNase YbeY [Peribacillus saganii]|uniref:Endoribonuclease YbeY n=1 Tax=Peribacillus saganii TaxID=2303992 RepID=A0A372LU16_9BACI|nr:rRNA maturation RNase YbeY [Peribacillus saganii]RFU71689.1 rRNA maturation RNase YbeY [Peribacillus saganii]
MIFDIDFIDETNEVSEKETAMIEELLHFAAVKEGIEEDCELSVTFTNNERIREINKEYREKDAATDVISFALEEMGEEEVQIVGADMPRMLGDIVISVEKTKEQAEEYGHSFERELGFLALHGFLHLLGYDHMDEQDEKEMFTKQRVILAEYGLTREQ